MVGRIPQSRLDALEAKHHLDGGTPPRAADSLWKHPDLGTPCGAASPECSRRIRGPTKLQSCELSVRPAGASREPRADGVGVG